MRDRLKLLRKISTLIVFVIACALKVHAQSYPVQANVALAPPYSPFLADYTAVGSQRFTSTLYLHDSRISNYQVKLRLTIEGVGITIRTKANYIPLRPITLYGGESVTLFGEDVEEYFDPNNLDFAGITKNQYEKGAKLPEGVYRFTLEVLDYHRGSLVSNKGTAVAWVILNDPPILNSPKNSGKLTIIDPQNAVFNWTPRQTGSPNSAFAAEYIFRLVEIWPANRNPYDAFLSQQPLYETTTSFTQIVYGPAEPALIPGRKYAWQVQAKDTEGRDLFKNQGKSEVYVFQFGDAMGVPQNFRRDAGSNSSVLNLRWEPAPDGAIPEQYRVRYRQKGDTRGVWYENVTQQLWAPIPNLRPDTEYEMQIRAEANSQYSEYSALQTFRTEFQDTPKYTCGADDGVAPITNTNLLLALTAGEVITARNFKLLITQVIGLGGNYTGTGWLKVPWFNGAGIRVNFSGPVNTDRVLIGGSVESVYHQGGPAAQAIDDANNIGKDSNRFFEKKDSAATVIPDYTVSGVIVSVNVNDDGKIVVVDNEGNETTFEQKKDGKTGKAKDTVIADASGNSYTVGEDGKVTKTSGSTGSNGAAVHPDPIKDRIIALILDQFEEEIGAWVRINGKGGEEDNEVLIAMEMPEAFPKNADFLTAFNDEVIALYKSKPEALRVKVEESESNKGILDDAASTFQRKEDVDFNKLSEDQQVSIRAMLADVLMANLGGEVAAGELTPVCGLSIAGKKKPLEARTLIFYPGRCSGFEGYLNGGWIVKLVMDGYGKYLCAKEKFDLIKCFVSGGIAGDQEEAIIKLFKDTPQQQCPDLLKLFKNDNSGLLAGLEYGFDNHNYVVVFQQLNELYMKGTSLSEINSEKDKINATFSSAQTRDQKASSNAFTWFEGGILKQLTSNDFVFSRFDDVTIAKNGDISFGYATNPNQTGSGTTLIKLKPFALVGFKVRGNANELLEAKNDFVYTPAILIPALVNEQDWKDFSDALNSTMILTGASTIVTGSGKMIVAGGIDVLFGGAGLAVENYKDDILAMQYGEDFMNYYVLANKAFIGYWTVKSIVSLAKALPAVRSSFERLKTSEDFLKLKATNPSKAEQIEKEVQTTLTKGDDLIENLLINYKKVGVDEAINLTNFKTKTSDQFVDVVVHFSNGKFKVIVEEGSVFAEYALETEQLAAVLNRVPSSKSIRLLSCNDIATAKELSAQLPGRSLYASDGWVDLYADGAIQSQNRFQKIVNGEVQSEVEMSSTSAKTEMITLGEKVAQATGKSKLLSKLNNLPNLKAWANSFDNGTDAILIAKVDGLDAIDLGKLNTDIAHTKYGPEIKELVKESPDDLTNIWKRLKDDPAYSWELQKTGGSRWEKWSQREFFKDVTAKGKNFESSVCLVAFKNRNSPKYLELKNKVYVDFGKNLDDYDMYSQVQLKYNGDDYFVADQIFVKYKRDALGRNAVNDIIVIENKLSSTTPLTGPQGNAITSNKYVVRNVDPKQSEFGSTNLLNQKDVLNFQDAQIKWYKVYDGGDGTIITGIAKL
ncbi:MAG TPA: fibronectin type III domain-containing protein [Ohtaekwangia sp.]|uniref:fibronectin type III domain-containing protein n=1 Tax=Ohtaekwangia sp. TaxID=2066019 RepID=UPI002F951726